MPKKRRKRGRGRSTGFKHSPATKRAIRDSMFGNRNAKKKRKRRKR